MELKNDNILKFNENTLEDVRQNYGFGNQNAIDSAVNSLQEWINKQNHFVKKDYDRKYLEIAIIQNKGSVERTKKRLERLCTFRTLLPHLFGDFDIRNDVKEFDGILKQVPLPSMTEDHNRVVIFRNCGKKFDSSLFLKYFRWSIAMVEYFRIRDYANSYIIIIDYRDVNLTELVKNLNLVDLQQGMSVMIEAYGLRVKALHILSPSKMIETVVRIFKQTFSEKLGNRINVHKDLETLYEHVPKEILPEDFGGEENCLDSLYDNFVKVLGAKEFRDYLKMMSEACTDESRRQKDDFNQEYMGMPGTFRTLSVD